MEMWDVFNSKEERTGKVISRNEQLKEGEYHLVVNVWIKSDEKFLIQKRPGHLKWNPGIWTTTGGCAIAGETPLEAVVRETKEELGLEFSETEFNFLFKQMRDNDFTYVYLVEANDLSPQIPFDKEEVAAVDWVTKSELKKMIAKGESYDYGEEYFSYLF